MADQKKLILTETQPYGRVEVWQQGTTRWLNLNDVVQTRLDLDRPDRLDSPVYTSCLVSLLFTDSPASVCLAGLGGGALARYIHSRFPEIRGQAIELHQAIADIAREYFEFPQTRWKLHVQDLRRWLAEAGGQEQELIIVDIAEGRSTPEWLTEAETLVGLRHQLTADGVLVIDLLATDADIFSNALTAIRNQFMRRTVCLSVPEHDNIIVAAFNSMPRHVSDDALRSRAAALTKTWGLDFSALLQQLYLDNPRGSGII